MKSALAVEITEFTFYVLAGAVVLLLMIWTEELIAYFWGDK